MEEMKQATERMQDPLFKAQKWQVQKELLTHASLQSETLAENQNLSQQDIRANAQQARNQFIEERPVEEIAGQIKNLHEKLLPRWKAFQKHSKWKNASHNSNPEPTFYDEEKQQERSAEFALSPSQLVNESLNDFVGMTLKVYDKNKLKELDEYIKSDKATNDAVKDLRQIAIHAEESMEKEALGLTFKAVENNPDTYKQIIENIVREKNGIKEGEPLPDTKKIKTDKFEALVVDLPKQMQKENPSEYEGLVFKYFKNYPPLVESELKLLTTPLLNQMSGSDYHHKDKQDIIENNPGIEQKLKAATSKNLPDDEKQQELQKFKDNNPEIFGMQDLDKKTFTFVGAGFPLTGILQHIQTDGAKINLIDYDEQAFNNAKKLIGITDSLGITKKGKVKVLHADARDVEYVKPGNAKQGQENTSSDNLQYVGRKKYKIETDVLDLASALPKDVTDAIMQKNAKGIDMVRKRNVSGSSTLLYERFDIPDGSIFRLGGHVTPPQKVLSGASPEANVTDIMSDINVNSDDLYVNKTNLQEKESKLTSDTPSSEVSEGGTLLWNQRTLNYYRSV